MACSGCCYACAAMPMLLCLRDGVVAMPLPVRWLFSFCMACSGMHPVVFPFGPWLAMAAAASLFFCMAFSSLHPSVFPFGPWLAMATTASLFGRHGVHCWVCDGKARRLNNGQRAAIVDYFHVYKGSENSNTMVSLTGHVLHPLLARSYSEVLKEFFEKLLCSQKLLSVEERYERILEMIPNECPGASQVFPIVNPTVLDQLRTVDCIIYAMGSLFTSICPSLLFLAFGRLSLQGPALR
ncbi:hypothetical protein U1Q18_003432 [Sarracenia purpurea var. burkii]